MCRGISKNSCLHLDIHFTWHNKNPTLHGMPLCVAIHVCRQTKVFKVTYSCTKQIFRGADIYAYHTFIMPLSTNLLMAIMHRKSSRILETNFKKNREETTSNQVQRKKKNNPDLRGIPVWRLNICAL